MVLLSFTRTFPTRNPVPFRNGNRDLFEALFSSYPPRTEFAGRLGNFSTQEMNRRATELNDRNYFLKCGPILIHNEPPP